MVATKNKSEVIGTVEYNGYEATMTVTEQRFFIIPGWVEGFTLTYDDNGFAQWWIPCQRRMVTEHRRAVKVNLTGRKVVKKFGRDMVAVNIEFLGDDEPSEFVKAFMMAY